MLATKDIVDNVPAGWYFRSQAAAAAGAARSGHREGAARWRNELVSVESTRRDWGGHQPNRGRLTGKRRRSCGGIPHVAGADGRETPTCDLARSKTSPRSSYGCRAWYGRGDRLPAERDTPGWGCSIPLRRALAVLGEVTSRRVSRVAVGSSPPGATGAECEAMPPLRSAGHHDYRIAVSRAAGLQPFAGPMISCVMWSVVDRTAAVPAHRRRAGRSGLAGRLRALDAGSTLIIEAADSRRG